MGRPLSTCLRCVAVEEEGEGKDGKKTRKKKKSAKKAKKIDWETHPFAQPKEALMCLDGGMYSQTNRPITAAHE